MFVRPPDRYPGWLSVEEALSAEPPPAAPSPTPPEGLHDDWCDGSGSSAGGACCRLAASPAPDPGLREAAAALVDEWDAAMAGDMPLNGHYQKQALDRLRAALASPAPDPGAGLAELQQLSEAATPGMWAPDVWGIWTANPEGMYGLGTRLYDADQAKDEDAAFIVAAVNYVRSLLAPSAEPPETERR